MKTLYFLIITMMILSLFSYVIPVRAQCYGCGQNSTALKQALLEKHEQNTTNLTQNVIITQNGNKITPFQTQENAATYERLFPQIVAVGIIGLAVISFVMVYFRRKNKK